jgi:crotonobetainyl-CoA:carnitine CoA-transferase CaiB-like acyl-CoA transferase
MMTFNNEIQGNVFNAVRECLPFKIDPGNILVEDGPSYSWSPIKVHDYAVGVMAAYGSAVEHLGVIRGLPNQTLTLNRRLAGLLLNTFQNTYINAQQILMDSWAVGIDSGIYLAQDGRHVSFIGLLPHLRDGIIGYFNGAYTQPTLQAQVEKKPAQQIEDELNELGFPAGIVRTPEEWLAHPAGQAASKAPLIGVESHGGPHGRKLGQARHRPLEGVRVIEIANIIAGPTSSRLLADQGADVIKVYPIVGGWALATALDTGWGKRNVRLDLRTPYGRARFTELLAEADVFLDGQGPGALARLGFGIQEIQSISPSIVLAGMSYPVRGTSWETRKGFEQIAQAVTGVVHVNSVNLPEPTYTSVLVNDYCTGYLTAAGMIAALIEREEKGGIWTSTTSLTRNSMEVVAKAADGPAEKPVPYSYEDLIAFGVDQDSPNGVWTRLRSSVEFSDTPSFSALILQP